MHLWYFVCVSKAGGGEHIFDIPEYKKIRVIVDTDAACEADDPYAIVHALLSPKLIVKGIAQSILHSLISWNEAMMK